MFHYSPNHTRVLIIEDMPNTVTSL